MSDDGGMAVGMAALLRVIAERDDARNALRGMAARCWMLRQVARESDTALRAAEPIIRAQVAAEIEAAGRAEIEFLGGDLSSLGTGRRIGSEDAWKAATRIARGGP